MVCETMVDDVATDDATYDFCPNCSGVTEHGSAAFCGGCGRDLRDLVPIVSECGACGHVSNVRYGAPNDFGFCEHCGVSLV